MTPVSSNRANRYDTGTPAQCAALAPANSEARSRLTTEGRQHQWQDPAVDGPLRGTPFYVQYELYQFSWMAPPASRRLPRYELDFARQGRLRAHASSALRPQDWRQAPQASEGT